jgi:hypothetical protein
MTRAREGVVAARSAGAGTNYLRRPSLVATTGAHDRSVTAHCREGAVFCSDASVHVLERPLLGRKLVGWNEGEAIAFLRDQATAFWRDAW